MPEQFEGTGLKYRRIADDLRAAIESGKYPPGSRLPTKTELMDEYDVAVNTVERAIKELRSTGLVETAQGAGMFVREPPSGEPGHTADERLDVLESEVKELRRQLTIIEAALMELYHRTGQEYPYGGHGAEQVRRVG